MEISELRAHLVRQHRMSGTTVDIMPLEVMQRTHADFHEEDSGHIHAHDLVPPAVTLTKEEAAMLLTFLGEPVRSHQKPSTLSARVKTLDRALDKLRSALS